MSTTKELAQRIGVSASTISRAMNGKPGLADALRRRILDEAAALNIRPSSSARSLSTSRTEQICFTVHHLAEPFAQDPFYGEVLAGAQQEVRDAGYHTLLEVMDDEDARDPARWRVVQERRADGILLNGPFVPASSIVKLHTLGVPVVLVDNFSKHVAVDAVVCDDRSGARALAEHLLTLGHRQVVVLAGPGEWYSIAERCAGFAEAFTARGLPVPTLLRREATTFETGQQLMAQALDLRPTAVLAVNDVMAMGASDVARQRGLRIPDDVSIAGFDDIEMAARWPTPLTTVRIERTYLGRLAARQLLSRLKDPAAPQQRTVVAASVVIRGSTGPA